MDALNTSQLGLGEVQVCDKDNKPPMFSFILPVYNAELYLDQCVTSILDQTYQSFEIVMVDDGSTDNSLSICHALMQKDVRVKVLTQVNRGPAAAKNVGIREASGEYITFIDNDDWISDQYFLEKIVAVIEKNHCDILFFGYKRYWEKSGLYTSSFSMAKSFNEQGVCRTEDFVRKAISAGVFSIAPFGKMLRRHRILTEKMFCNESLLHADDIEWTFRCLPVFSELFILLDDFYVYRIRKSNDSSSSIQSLKKWDMRFDAIKLAYDDQSWKRWSTSTQKMVLGYLSYQWYIMLMLVSRIPSQADRQTALSQLARLSDLRGMEVGRKAKASAFIVRLFGLNLGSQVLYHAHNLMQGTVRLRGEN